jgi:hypothetical protein
VVTLISVEEIEGDRRNTLAGMGHARAERQSRSRARSTRSVYHRKKVSSTKENSPIPRTRTRCSAPGRTPPGAGRRSRSRFATVPGPRGAASPAPGKRRRADSPKARTPGARRRRCAGGQNPRRAPPPLAAPGARRTRASGARGSLRGNRQVLKVGSERRCGGQMPHGRVWCRGGASRGASCHGGRAGVQRTRVGDRKPHCQSYEVTAPAALATASSQLYFDAQMSGPGDTWWIDDIVILAY